MAKIQVSVGLLGEISPVLGQTPEQFVKEMRIAAAVKWYEIEMVSQARAAEIAGLSRAEFIGALNRFGVTPFQVDAIELVEEVHTVAH